MNLPREQLLLAVALFLSSFICARASRRRPALGPLRIPFLAAAVLACLEAVRLTLPEPLRLEVLTEPLDFLFYFSLAIVGIRLAQWVSFDLFLQRYRHLQAPDVLKDIVSFAIYVIVFVVLFQRIFHTSVTPVLATSAVLTAVIGLAMQDSFGNLFAGISLRMEESLNIGDWVGIGPSIGKVTEMRWRALKLLTLDGDIIIFPNAMAAKERIENYSHPAGPHARRVRVGVSYEHPPAHVIEILTDLASRIPGVLSEPPVEAKVVDYLDFSVTYEVKYWGDAFVHNRTIEGEIRRLVWYRFRREGIEIPYPIRQVRFRRDRAAEETVEQDARQAEKRLGSIDIFSPLSAEERRELARRCRKLHFAPGEVVVRQGDPGASFYVVDSGRLQVLAGRDKDADKSSRINAMAPGDFFGEISLLTGEPRTATVIAERDSVVYEIGVEAFHEILRSRPSIAESLSRILGQRRGALEAKLSELSDEPKAGTEDEVARNFLQRIRAFFHL